MAAVMISFGIILVVMVLMSMGLFFGRRPLSGGSCGGEDPAGCAGCEKYGKDAGPQCPKEKG
ncbi:MAG: hypothetical protein LBO65_01890 [Spirochaetaceae bacterium]|jgi:hypothetical protein|nr:hypothetical protein [Spirochaetaceae bacterium]